MSLENQINNTIMKRIKSIGIVICMMATLAVTLLSCSENTDEITYQLISGTWTLESNPLCKWSFHVVRDLDVAYPGNCNITIDTIRTSGSWRIDNNTLTLNLFGGNAVLGIDKISQKKLILSGTINFYHYDGGIRYDSYVDIDYVFKK